MGTASDTLESVTERLCAIVTEELEIEDVEVTSESDFFADLDADSLSLVELSVAVKDEFGVKLDRDDIKEATKVGEFAAALHQKMLASV